MGFVRRWGRIVMFFFGFGYLVRVFFVGWLGLEERSGFVFEGILKGGRGCFF